MPAGQVILLPQTLNPGNGMDPNLIPQSTPLTPVVDVIVSSVPTMVPVCEPLLTVVASEPAMSGVTFVSGVSSATVTSADSSDFLPTGETCRQRREGLEMRIHSLLLISLLYQLSVLR